MGIVNFELFLLAGILLNLTPGNDTIFILGKSLSHGKTTGIYSALGIGAGSLIHTLLAAFGLSIIVAESEIAFNFIKYLGSLYLVFLGFKMIFTRSNTNVVADNRGQNNARIFWSAVLTNVLNPKVAIFFLAFLPQFIDPSTKTSFVAFVLLGLTFTVTGTLWGITLAFFSSKIHGRLSGSSSLKIWMNRISGLTFIGLGVKLALTSRLK